MKPFDHEMLLNRIQSLKHAGTKVRSEIRTESRKEMCIRDRAKTLMDTMQDDMFGDMGKALATAVFLVFLVMACLLYTSHGT